MSSETLPQTSLTVITVLTDGRHLVHQAVFHDEQEAVLAAATHFRVRGVHCAGIVEKFVVVRGADVQEDRP